MWMYASVSCSGARVGRKWGEKGGVERNERDMDILDGGGEGTEDKGQGKGKGRD